MKKALSALMVSAMVVSIFFAQAFSISGQTERFIDPRPSHTLDTLIFSLKEGYTIIDYDVFFQGVDYANCRQIPKTNIYVLQLPQKSAEKLVEAFTFLENKTEVEDVSYDNLYYYVIEDQEANKAAYDKLTSPGTEGYLNVLRGYYEEAEKVFVLGNYSENPFIADYLEKLNEAKAMIATKTEVHPYISTYDYAAWFTNRDISTVPPICKMQSLAIKASGINTGLPIDITQKYVDVVMQKELYTEESMAIFEQGHTEALENAESKKCSSTTDKEAIEAVQSYYDFFKTLKPIFTKNATYNYYARQAAKITDQKNEFVKAFNAVAAYRGDIEGLEAELKTLQPLFNSARNEFCIGTEFSKEIDRLFAKYGSIEAVKTLCLSENVKRLTNYGTASECAEYISFINDAAATDPQTVEKAAAKEACFGNSDRGTFVVNFKTAYNKYKTLVTLDENKGVAYNNYCTLLEAYNEEYASEQLLEASEYEQMRDELERAWWAMRKEACIGTVFMSKIAKAAIIGSTAQQNYAASLTNAFYSSAIDAECAARWAEFSAL